MDTFEGVFAGVDVIVLLSVSGVGARRTARIAKITIHVKSKASKVHNNRFVGVIALCMSTGASSFRLLTTRAT